MRHYLQLHLLVLLIATTAILGELISLSASGLVVWRTIFAALGAALWVTLARRRSIWPGKRMAGILFGIGLIVGVHWVCFFGAIKLANVSISLAGMVAMLGALLAAIFPVLNRKLVTTGGDPLTMVAWEMVGACTAALILFPFVSEGESLLAWRDLDWLWILILAWVCTVFAHGFHIHLLRHRSAYTMNLAFNFEPVYGIIAAALLFSEHKQLNPFFYAGMGTILLANLAHVLVMRRLAQRNRALP